MFSTATIKLLLLLYSSTYLFLFTHCFVVVGNHHRTPKQIHVVYNNKAVTTGDTIYHENKYDDENENRFVIALTREDGKNDKLYDKLIQTETINNQLRTIIEIPCIEHANGPDYDKLREVMATEDFDYIVITSPEAARVLASAWEPESNNNSQVVAVGKATEHTLKKHNIQVSFCPSKATAKTLAKELPLNENSKITKVLYPASVRAKPTLQKDLEQRSEDGSTFQVTRLNTYDTVTAQWTPEQKELSKDVTIVCIGSPSSLDGWLYNTNNQNKDNLLIACIGETSANACRENNFKEHQIFYPEDNPGIDGWVEAIGNAIHYASSSSNSDKQAMRT